MSKKTVSVNLSPTEAKLEQLKTLYYAIDMMIVHFIEINPLRHDSNGESGLDWDWAVVKIDNDEIPVPVHTSGEGAVLYNWDKQPVPMSREECAYTTGAFYLTSLFQLSQDIEGVMRKVNPILVGNLVRGLRAVEKMGPDKTIRLIDEMKSKLTYQGISVLN